MKKNLIIRLSAMGDVAMIAPVLECAAKQNPNAKFVVVTSKRFDAFFSHIENVECLCISKKSTGSLFSIFLFSQRINRLYDIGCVIDLHGVLRSKILGFFFKMRCIPVFSIDKNRKQKKSIIEKKISADNRLPRVTQFYADLIRKSGVEFALENKLVPKVRDISHLDEIYTKSVITDRFIGLAPFAQHEGKRLPEHKIDELVVALLQNENNKIFMFGGSSGERQFCEKISSKYDRVISVVGVLSLSEELSFISNLDVMVSMDSGAQHMASLVGVRAITVWGATNPSVGFIGFGQSYDDCVVPNLDCNPCSVYGNKPCYKGTYECLHTVSVQKIVALAELH